MFQEKRVLTFPVHYLKRFEMLDVCELLEDVIYMYCMTKSHHRNDIIPQYIRTNLTRFYLPPFLYSYVCFRTPKSAGPRKAVPRRLQVTKTLQYYSNAVMTYKCPRNNTKQTWTSIHYFLNNGKYNGNVNKDVLINNSIFTRKQKLL